MDIAVKLSLQSKFADMTILALLLVPMLLLH